MGKVVKFTGSRLLGEELRRLRAGRTLDDVVELGKTKLVPSGFRYVGKGTLSDIENGKVLPNLESVFALSVLYQVPASRFLHFLLEENVVEGIAAPETEEELLAAFTDAVKFRRWSEALALAVHGVKRNPTGWSQIRWRLNRATAMEQLGMRQDAIIEATGCLDEPAVPALERYKIHNELARMHSDAGHLSLARLHIEEAVRLLPETTSADIQVRILQNRARIALTRYELGLERSNEALDSAFAWIREARLLAAPLGDESAKLALDLYAAVGARLAGDGRRARKQLLSTLASAQRIGIPHREAEALVQLAIIDADDAERARKLLVRAAEICVNHGLMDGAFHAYLQLTEVAESQEQRLYFFKKCQRLYPHVASNLPSVRAFERLRAKEIQ